MGQTHRAGRNLTLRDALARGVSGSDDRGMVATRRGSGESCSADARRVALPVGLAQLALEDLAGAGLWQRLPAQLDALGDLVAGDQALGVVDELRLGDVGDGDDDGVHRLAPALVGD